jgi:hypothetical protein
LQFLEKYGNEKNINQEKTKNRILELDTPAFKTDKFKILHEGRLYHRIIFGYSSASSVLREVGIYAVSISVSK